MEQNISSLVSAFSGSGSLVSESKFESDGENQNVNWP
jgi:hypothetical protein